MSKTDIILTVLAGEGMAWLLYDMIKDSGPEGIEIKTLGWFLFIIFPFLALFAFWVSDLIGKKFLFIFQVAKFVLIGVLATLLDLVIFRSLGWIFIPIISLPKTVFKGISFIIATLAKYWGNKLWAFEKSEMAGAKKEFTQFFIITLIGLVMNVAAFSLFVNTIGPQFGIPSRTWETIGVIFAALAVAVWNFSGYKFIVFKK